MALLPSGLAKTGVVPYQIYPKTISQSLRFEDGDSAYLSRTPASAGNQQVFTISTWFKRGNLGSGNAIFGAWTNVYNYFHITFGDGTIDDRIRIMARFGSLSTDLCYVITDPVYRDPSAWYHLVVEVDTTLATAADRCKIYINGVLQTLDTGAANFRYLLQENTAVNNTAIHEIGNRANGTLHFDGYLAEFHLTDGTAYDADAFGELKSGIWVAKRPSVTYGTNGFHLDGSDITLSGSDITFVNDTSTNSNNFTANNLVASDVVPDSPTNNFNVMNPALFVAGINCTYSEGNLKVLRDASNWESVHSTMAVNSGKWYWEVYISGTNHMISVCDPNSEVGEVASVYTRIGLWTLQDTGYRYLNFVNDTTYNGLLSFASGDVMMVAMDVDAGNVYIGKNGTWFIIET